MVYLDDVVVYSPDHDTHLEQLRQVFERLAMHGLSCAPHKFHLGKTELEYLGHVIGPEGNRSQEHHLRQFATAGAPKSRKELR